MEWKRDYQVRLIVLGRCGYEWFKWVVEIEVSQLSVWWETPLPLQ